MNSSKRSSLVCLIFAVAASGANCPNDLDPVLYDRLDVTPTLREACSTLDTGIPLDDAFIQEQLLALEEMRLAGVQKPMANNAARGECILRINEPCDGVVCSDDNDLPLHVDCMECASAIATQIYGEIFEP